MLKFRKFISEEVIPTASVSDGSIDLEKPAVRGQINATLAGVTARPCVTPYVALHKIMKALAYFSIVIPRKTYMEGDRGVEVYELNQFGHRMGMTDQGEFVHEVPNKYFLFLQYRTMEPMGVIYAKPTVGGMFKVTAKVVDQVELDKLLSMAELSLAEDANLQQQKAKVMAPKEPVKPGCHDGTESTKQAVEVSMRRKDKKLSADQLDEISMGKLVAYKNKAGEGREKGLALADKKLKGKAKINATAPKHPYMEETLDETRMPASVIKHKQKLANMTPEEKAKKFAGKSEEQLKSMARRHGYGKDSDVYSKHLTKEETLDEGFAKIVKSVKRSLKGWPAQPLHGEGGKKPMDVVKRTRGRSDSDVKSLASDSNKAAEHSPAGLQKNVAKQEMKRRKLDEKLTKGMSPADVISDFVHSDDPKFKGKSKKERMKMALGAYYGMHPEKSRKD